MHRLLNLLKKELEKKSHRRLVGRSSAKNEERVVTGLGGLRRGGQYRRELTKNKWKD